MAFTCIEHIYVSEINKLFMNKYTQADINNNKQTNLNIRGKQSTLSEHYVKQQLVWDIFLP